MSTFEVICSLFKQNFRQHSYKSHVKNDCLWLNYKFWYNLGFVCYNSVKWNTNRKLGETSIVKRSLSKVILSEKSNFLYDVIIVGKRSIWKVSWKKCIQKWYKKKMSIVMWRHIRTAPKRSNLWIDYVWHNSLNSGKKLLQLRFFHFDLTHENHVMKMTTDPKHWHFTPKDQDLSYGTSTSILRAPVAEISSEQADRQTDTRPTDGYQSANICSHPYIEKRAQNKNKTKSWKISNILSWYIWNDVSY